MSFSEGYRLLQRIGSGAAGLLYLAESSRGQIVIRQFEADAAPDSEQWSAERQSFLGAARKVQPLKHARIVPVLDVIDKDDEAFVASEYVTAPSLEPALASRKMRPEEAGPLLRDIAMALDYAHSNGVVHGDLKPSCIFLPNLHASVADFAISARARLLPGQSVPRSLVHRFLSPEHISGDHPVSAESDQYALAVIAYEMYTGQSPYGTSTDWASAILHSPIVEPSKVSSELPRALDDLFLRALDRDPTHRFNSCIEFVSRVDAAFIVPAPPKPNPLKIGTVLAVPMLAGLWLFYAHGRPPKPGEVSGLVSDDKRAPVTQADVNIEETKTGQTYHTQTDAAGRYEFPSVIPGSYRLSVTRSGLNDSHSSSFDVSPAQNADLGDLTMRTPERPKKKPPIVVVTPPPPTPPPVKLPVVGQEQHQQFGIQVFSRENLIRDGGSFAYGDQAMGELAHGDITAKVTFDGAHLPRGALTLEWVVDGVTMDRRTVHVGVPIEYGNEPTKGTYVLTLYADKRPVKQFQFRISP